MPRNSQGRRFKTGIKAITILSALIVSTSLGGFSFPHLTQEAFASNEYVISDEQSCLSLPISGGGSIFWGESPDTCSIRDDFNTVTPRIETGESLSVTSGITLIWDGELKNNGLINNEAVILNHGSFYNNATMNNLGDFVTDDGDIHNSDLGTITNYADFLLGYTSGIRNYGVINNTASGFLSFGGGFSNYDGAVVYNHGTFKNCCNDGLLENYGTIHNYKVFVHDGWQSNNHATIYNYAGGTITVLRDIFRNYGTINNDYGATIAISNLGDHGVINNFETVNNDGMMTFDCETVISGPVNGNEPVDVCAFH